MWGRYDKMRTTGQHVEPLPRHPLRVRAGLTTHAVPAGFTVLPRGKTGYYGLVGPGLTEGGDEATLTTNALWEAVTAQPGTQNWYETVRVICRSKEAEAARKAENDRVYGPGGSEPRRRRRSRPRPHS